MPRPGPTPLIGRDREVDHLVGLVRAGERLVTLVGPGGAGKTRVADAALLQIEAEDAAVGRVGLASVRPGGVVPAIAAALGHRTGSDAADVMDELADALSDRELVLLLDTFEPVLADAPAVAALLDRCDGLQLVVTSRARLRVRQEHVVALDPLELTDAVTLLLRRAEAAGAPIHDADPAVVSAICAELEQSPLAIELAATRLNVLDPTGLLDQLRTGPRRRLQALGAGPADGADRHRSLDATIAWTDTLLSDSAARLLRALSVASGPVDLPLIEALGSAVLSPGDGGAGGDVLTALTELVEFHLVVRAEEADGTRRFHLLDTIAAYAGLQCEADGLVDVSRAAHDAFVRALVEAGQQGLASPEESVWHERLEAHRFEIQSALERAASDGDGARGMEITSAMAWHWLQYGPVFEISHYLSTFMPLVDREGADGRWWWRGEAWDSYLALERGQPGAVDRLEAAVAELTDAIDPQEAICYRDLLVRARIGVGRHEDAEPVAEADAELSAAKGWPALRCRALLRQAEISAARGDLESATDLAQLVLRLSDDCGHDAGLARAASVLAFVRDRAGDRDAAARALEQAVDAHLRAGHRRHAAGHLGAAARVALQRGRVEESVLTSRRALSLSTELGYRLGEAVAVMVLGCTATQLGWHEDAAVLYRAIEPEVDAMRRGLIPDGSMRGYDETVARTVSALGPRRHEEITAAPLSWAELLRRADDLAVRMAGHLAAGHTDPSQDLTAREIEVLRCLARGLSNKDIAQELFISAKTVMHHTGRIYRKLDVGGRTEAVARAFELGLVDHGAPDHGDP